ncbi:MAG: peptide-methionine (S)-S-oxide reductase MsrA [Bacteroidales bacterium]
MKILFLLSVLPLTFAYPGSYIGKIKTLAQLTMENINTDTATFGGGCFWCVEAIFQRLEGVEQVLPGYAGGHTENPTYNEVCTGNTGHAEVARIVFNPEKISFTQLLEVFWQTHDPTTLNRQGNDIGTQYRSVIFCHSEGQKKLAVEMKDLLTKEEIWEKPIVTEISPLTNFYVAEDYHHNYYNKNSSQQYCAFVITPKIEKFKKLFTDKLKEPAR